MPSPITAHCHLATPDWLRPTYRDIRFVSRLHHLNQGKRADHDVLYVASDWLTWYAALTKGLPTLHLEAGTVEAADEDSHRDDFFLKADSWTMRDGADLTLFRGVSLGRLFTRETSLLGLSWHQMSRSLDWLGRRVRAETWTLSDIRTEFGLVDADTKRDLISRAAGRAGSRFVDTLDEPPDGCREFPMIGNYRVRPPAIQHKLGERLRGLLRSGYGATLGCLSSMLSEIGRQRRPILMIPTGLMLGNLLGAYHSSRTVAPMLIAERETKSPAFLARALSRGARFAHLPIANLDDAEQRRIEQMRSDLGIVLPDLDGTAKGALGHYVRHTVLGGNLLENAAVQVKRVDRQLRQYQPDRIVVTDVMNPGTREYIELGHRQGIPVDYLAHGMRISRQRHDVLTGDDRHPPRVARFLSWGAQGEQYLADRGHPVPSRRIGYPAIDHLRGALPPAPNQGRALVLPYSVDTEGLVNMSGFVYGGLIETIETLRRQGFSDIRVKIHPGSLFNRDYYTRVLALLDEPVDVIHGDGHLPEQLAWADIVVGPIVSSSTVESLAAGRPYFPVLYKPSVNESRYAAGLDLIGGGDDLARSLSEGQRHDPAAVLEYLCSANSIPNASAAFWDAMEDVPASQPVCTM